MLFTGCSNSLENEYDTTNTSSAYNLGDNVYLGSLTAFSSDYALINDNIYNSEVDESLSEAGLIVCLDDNSVNYSKNCYERLYPASTTKILTAYLVVENCDNLDDTFTISDTALDLESGSSVCGFAAGDVVSVRDALYGLILRSGNEAAIALAEYVSGSTDAFSELMNENANYTGATLSHFVNPNGLTNENHYTSAYDLYMIFKNALENEDFYEIITSSSYTAEYTDSSGNTVTQEWSSTNSYLSGSVEAPEGVTVLGGKTGTTSAAGSCLVLLSESSSGKRYISVILNAENHDNLYTLMNQLLATES
ncbi:MAG: serine hydrolase [Eubacterium sp.]|nr:serine hydrolase [Eubacterium sp.]